MSSVEPEEPHLRSEPNLLSPVSPRPIPFPTPTNIPVLEMQMDVGFNQTEIHMNDPAMHNTDVRPDAWRDPKEIEAETEAAAAAAADVSDELATKEAEALQTTQDISGTADSLGVTSGDETVENVTDSNIDSAIDSVQADVTSLSSPTDAIMPNLVRDEDTLPTSTEPSMPSAETAVPSQTMQADENGDVSQAQPLRDPVDVQTLWDALNPASTATSVGDLPTVPALPSIDIASAPAQAGQSQDATEVQHSATRASDAEAPPSSGLGEVPSGLPPRPPPQEQPLIHPNYVHSQHMRDYHPHASNPAFQPHNRTSSQNNVTEVSSGAHVPPVLSPSNVNAAASIPGVSAQSEPAAYPSNLTIPANVPAPSSGHPTAGTVMSYPPNASSFQSMGYTASPQTMYGMQYPSATSTPVDGRRERTLRDGDPSRAEDRPWDAETQRKYDRFIEEEREYVSEGRWEQFPQGSRLFVGNLSSERVTKRDIFHVFHTYGQLAQISIKNAYGFVQFLRTEDCARALQMEQGTQIRDKKIHLEVSKPQKNRTQNTQRRSRSPPNRSRPGSNVDRYVSGSRGDNRGSYGGSYRSPSPRGYRDRHEERYRRRSRSPDYNRGGRYRSPSPRRDVDDDLPLPRRAPHDVPDVQVVVLDSTLDRDFISWVESAFSTRGLRVGVLRLAPHLPEQAVVRRQIIEGVLAVIKLTRMNQNMSKIGLVIFDRSQGANNVKFEEYEGLDPPVAVQLVQRAKTTANPYSGYSGYSAPPPNPAYAGYGAPPPGSYAPPSQQQGYQTNYNNPPPPSLPPGHVPPNLQNLITNLEPNHLQSLLSAMSTPGSANAVNAYAPPGSQPASALAALQNNPSLAGYLQQQQMAGAPPPSGASATPANGQVMQDILARLGTGKR